MLLFVGVSNDRLLYVGLEVSIGSSFKLLHQQPAANDFHDSRGDTFCTVRRNA